MDREKRPPFEITDHQEAEKADYYVCLRCEDDPHEFPDNMTGFCALCGVPIIYRPHAPITPRKICTICAGPKMAADPDWRVLVTPTVAQEVSDFIAKERRRKAN